MNCESVRNIHLKILLNFLQLQKLMTQSLINNVLYAISGISGLSLLAFILRYITPFGICSLNCLVCWYKVCWKCTLCYFHNLRPTEESHLDKYKSRAHYKVAKDLVSVESGYTGNVNVNSPKEILTKDIRGFSPLKKPNNFPHSTVKVEDH